MRRHLRFVPQLLMVAFALWCCVALHADLSQLSLAPVLHAWDVVGFAAVLSLLNYGLRIVRWRAYLARLGHPVPPLFAAFTYVAGFAYTLSPGKVGEMVRARYYLPAGVPLADVTAGFFAERLMDVVAMTVLAAFLVVGIPRYQLLVIAAASLATVALVALTTLPWTRIAAALYPAGSARRRIRATLASLASALASTRPLLRPGLLFVGFAAGLAAWGLEGVGLGLLSSMVPTLHLGLATAIGIYAVAVLAGALTFLPGGLGSTEAVMTALLVASGCSLSEGLLITLTCRVVTLWLAVGLGWVCVLLLRQRSIALAAPWR